MPLRPRSRPLALLLAAVLLTGCTGDTEGPQAESGVTPSTLEPGDAALDLSGLPVPREPWCDMIPAQATRQALASSPADSTVYGNGDRVEVEPGRREIVHEIGCRFEAADGAHAWAWVFVPQVTTEEAERAVRRGRRQTGCQTAGSLSFGTPSLVTVCRLRQPAQVRARLEGLFSDSWVGCEVAAPSTDPPSRAARERQEQDVLRRAEQWCIEVVTAAAS